MKLSDRDLKLLVIFLLAAVIALPIVFILRPYDKKIEEVNSHIAELTERQQFLAKLNENRQFYNDSIALLTEERDKIVENYAKGLRDENSIMFLANTEKQIPIAMRTLSFSTDEPTTISESYVGPDGETVEGLRALTSYTSVEFVTSYENFKTFLQYILDSKEKMVLASVTADQDDSDGNITGVFILNQYAVTGEGRELESAKIPSMDHGVDNVFGKPQGLEDEEEPEETPVEEE